MAALVAAAACSDVTELQAGPTDRYYFPTGAAVTADGTLLVASSNFDLRYDQETGGSVIAVNPSAEPAPDLAGLLGAANVGSLGGQLAVADPVACTALPDPAAGAVAILPVRGADLVYRLRVADGAVSCADCAVAVASAARADPYAVGVACGPGIARAYVGYLRSGLGESVLTQLDLTRDPADPGAVQHVFYEGDRGQVRGFAYDADRERLYVAHTARSGETSIRWIDLGGGCDLGVGANACVTGETKAGAVPRGVEVRGIALSHSDVPFRRAYLTVRIYDPVLADIAGFRNTEFDGRLVVADLVETLTGELDLAIVREIDLGYGAGDVVVLPSRGAGRGDLVAALATDSGRVTLYDDETVTAVGIGADLAGTGAPLVGHVPVALAVDPRASDPARLYVASFQESFVSAIDVPLDNPEGACLVAPGGGCATGPDSVRHIRGGVRQ